MRASPARVSLSSRQTALLERMRRNVSRETSAREWYSIRNQAGGEAEPERAVIDIYDEIGGGGWWGGGIDPGDFVRDLRKVTAPVIELHVNSPGGVIHDGLVIYNALLDHPARVESIVDGLAASAASWITLAGDHVTMNRHSQMMIHDGMGLAMGTAADMREMAELLDLLSNNIADIYAARAGGKREAWRAAMVAETWYSAEDAVRVGLADAMVTDAPAEGDSGEGAAAANNVRAAQRSRLIRARARAREGVST